MEGWIGSDWMDGWMSGPNQCLDRGSQTADLQRDGRDGGDGMDGWREGVSE